MVGEVAAVITADCACVWCRGVSLVAWCCWCRWAVGVAELCRGLRMRPPTSATADPITALLIICLCMAASSARCCRVLSCVSAAWAAAAAAASAGSGARFSTPSAAGAFNAYRIAALASPARDGTKRSSLGRPESAGRSGCRTRDAAADCDRPDRPDTAFSGLDNDDDTGEDASEADIAPVNTRLVVVWSIPSVGGVVGRP